MTVPVGPDAGRDNEYEALIDRVADQNHGAIRGMQDWEDVRLEMPATLTAVADLIDGWADADSRVVPTSHGEGRILDARIAHYRATAARLRGLKSS